MSPSIWQLLIVLAIVLLIFGAKRLRNLGGDLGSAVKGFKNAMSDEEEKSASEKSDPDRLQGTDRGDDAGDHTFDEDPDRQDSDSRR